ncbi:MAG: hypothetical protein ACR2KK_12865 [Acidimicrobiales bacterium]
MTVFYGRRLATASFSEEIEVADVPRRNLDRIYHHSSEAMAELPDNSVALMVTSPPTTPARTTTPTSPTPSSSSCSAPCSPRCTGC